METRTFNKTGEEISLLGFGMMRLPSTDEASLIVDEKTTAAMIGNAIDHGVNYFDTALPYHNGMSEVVVGKILSHYPREKFYLADKMPIWLIKSVKEVEEVFQRQLKTCGVDYFDFYLLHNLSIPKIPRIEAMKAYEYLARQKKEGKIRHLGFSFHDTPDALAMIADQYEWDFAQIQLNYLDWELQNAKRQYEILTERKIPVAVMEPIRGGALADLCPGAVNVLKNASPDASPASWALRFAASLPNVFTVLSGMSKPEQLADNLRTFENFRPLSEGERKVLDKALDVYRKSAPIPCTACRYCMDCPNGVDIPKNFAIYNRWLTTKNWSDFISSYFVMEEGKRAVQCIGCGICQEKCPQKLDIPGLMPKIEKAFQEIEKPDWFA
ncbi:MAG: aldo/keto reductase [Planctomycetia bacterium]|nr:aldo/keto reductase [Planctomycetia bacterium]